MVKVRRDCGSLWVKKESNKFDAETIGLKWLNTTDKTQRAKIYPKLIYSSTKFHFHGLTRGSSLSVENKDDLLVSPNGLFTAGFHEVGDNAYAFAVWFSGQHATENRTVVWMANRDAPLNGRQSKLSLWKDGSLVLLDAGRNVMWSSDTKSTSSSLRLRLYDTGNLVLDDEDAEVELFGKALIIQPIPFSRTNRSREPRNLFRQRALRITLRVSIRCLSITIAFFDSFTMLPKLLPSTGLIRAL
ncbi:hypothetical protein OSB04_013930 [Centaurea solstitialis]|uniref:Bulb-type lectin domain-containing protein n=1 Tax=Centaurea solstitialis TaxID=347529 RepID=A0AA38TPS9_9ASTR|nr:hypothetical protein OSB04_013930 [Centaurea solstitialis]